MKQVEGQCNFIADGFGKGKCDIDNTYDCTHYWAKWTKENCGDGDCKSNCCYGCKERKYCGYACNASGEIRKEIIRKE